MIKDSKIYMHLLVSVKAIFMNQKMLLKKVKKILKMFTNLLKCLLEKKKKLILNHILQNYQIFNKKLIF